MYKAVEILVLGMWLLLLPFLIRSVQHASWITDWDSDLTFSQIIFDDWDDDNSNHRNINWYHDFLVTYDHPGHAGGQQQTADFLNHAISAVNRSLVEKLHCIAVF